MKVLVLEDNLERMKGIRRSLVGHLHTHVASAEAAIDCIKMGAYDALMLDHDLGDDHYNGIYDENTGMAVVNWLLEHPEQLFRFRIIVVHSLNLPRGREMVERLNDISFDRAFYVPGIWMDANKRGVDVFSLFKGV